jgi:hypothetical protein
MRVCEPGLVTNHSLHDNPLYKNLYGRQDEKLKYKSRAIFVQRPPDEKSKKGTGCGNSNRE